MLKYLLKRIFKKEKKLLKPVKTNFKPKWKKCAGGKCKAISNWHWRKYLSGHMPLEDWELKELNMSPEEASIEIKEWDR